jgi:hypothetical protein
MHMHTELWWDFESLYETHALELMTLWGWAHFVIHSLFSSFGTYTCVFDYEFVSICIWHMRLCSLLIWSVCVPKYLRTLIWLGKHIDCIMIQMAFVLCWNSLANRGDVSLWAHRLVICVAPWCYKVVWSGIWSRVAPSLWFAIRFDSDIEYLAYLYLFDSNMCECVITKRYVYILHNM